MNDSPIRLTQFAHGGGCGCKIAPSVLSEILRTDNPQAQFPALLVGNASNDDAAVYELDNGNCLVSTTDFFMPIVDDAFDFGRIAGANAIGDVYAMGAKPIMAIAVLGWPVEKLPAELAARVLEGARTVCTEAGIPLAGGHSIDSPEPFFGLSVNGLVAKARLKQNNTAREGDLLLLTKPLGTGALATAMKREKLLPEHFAPLLKNLTTLNSIGPQLAAIDGVHAMTDVTGFGLLGHLIEMTAGSGLSARLIYQNVQTLPGTRDYIGQRITPDATFRNWNSYSKQVKFEKGLNVMEAFSLLPDPQTNGGLLVAVAPEALPAVQECLRNHGLEAFAEPVGSIVAKGEFVVEVV
jgi:selenide, water dikinase